MPAIHVRPAPALITLLLVVLSTARAGDQWLISDDGHFGAFASLGESAATIAGAAPDRVETNEADQHRVTSRWLYYNDRGIRVRVCSDDGQIAAVNARITPSTRRFVTDAGVNLGDTLEQVRESYGGRLKAVDEVDAPVYAVTLEPHGDLLTFGFDGQGRMTWVALGRPRANGYTCGHASS